jgi:SAM-dependent methyltransferase
VQTDEGFFGERVAVFYDERSTDASRPEVVGPVADMLAEFAGDGSALEFGIGTGRIAIPLAEKGVRVVGIDNSDAMLSRLRAKPEAAGIDAVLGDFATTHVDGDFSVAYLVFNTISNLVTQDAQVACFENAAAHLRPGGRFVIENGVPALQSLPPGQTVIPFRADREGFSFDVYDVVTQNSARSTFTSSTASSRRSPSSSATPGPPSWT